MKKVEGSYWCNNDGPVVFQCSVWDILNESEGKKMLKLIQKISRRNKGSVEVTVSLEKEEEAAGWER